MKFRTDDRGYDYIARVAYKLESIQEGLHALIFRTGWEKRHEKLKREQRAKGIDDDTFLHTRRRRERGLPILIGRRNNH